MQSVVIFLSNLKSLYLLLILPLKRRLEDGSVIVLEKTFLRFAITNLLKSIYRMSLKFIESNK